MRHKFWMSHVGDKCWQWPVCFRDTLKGTTRRPYSVCVEETTDDAPDHEEAARLTIQLTADHLAAILFLTLCENSCCLRASVGELKSLWLNICVPFDERPHGAALRHCHSYLLPRFVPASQLVAAGTCFAPWQRQTRSLKSQGFFKHESWTAECKNSEGTSSGCSAISQISPGTGFDLIQLHSPSNTENI